MLRLRLRETLSILFILPLIDLNLALNLNLS